MLRHYFFFNPTVDVPINWSSISGEACKRETLSLSWQYSCVSNPVDDTMAGVVCSVYIDGTLLQSLTVFPPIFPCGFSSGWLWLGVTHQCVEARATVDSLYLCLQNEGLFRTDCTILRATTAQAYRIALVPSGWVKHSFDSLGLDLDCVSE